jgi:hypothetical protein
MDKKQLIENAHNVEVKNLRSTNIEKSGVWLIKVLSDKELVKRCETKLLIIKDD